MKTIYKINNQPKLSPIAHTFALVSLLSAIYYISYLLDPANIGDIILYLVFVVSEVYVIFMAILAWWTILFHDKDPAIIFPKNMSKTKILEGLRDSEIAVIIPVYNEPISIVEEAMQNAIKLEMHPKIYIGDDSNNPEIKKLAETYGIKYFTRTERDYFKSGNVSNVLKKIKADYIAVFDVDHLPEKNFLSETMGYMADPKVGFVQTPQYYTNTDNVISKGASGAQNIFYELIMPGKNAFNAAFCVGTNVLFRSAALKESFKEDLFYLAYHSEDIWASLKLHENGWKSVYIPKVLTHGLAPDTLQQFFKQQDRWARGGYEILLKNNPLFSKFLSWEQKVQYFATATHYFSGFVILIYFFVPIIFLLTGQKPLSYNLNSSWAIHFLPFFLSKFLLIIYLMGRIDISLISTSFALFPVYINAFFKELRSKGYHWVVTNSKVKRGDSVFDYLEWHFFLILLSFLAIIFGILNMEDRVSALIFSFWAFLNSLILIHFIYNSLRIEFGYKKV